MLQVQDWNLGDLLIKGSAGLLIAVSFTLILIVVVNTVYQNLSQKIDVQTVSFWSY